MRLAFGAAVVSIACFTGLTALALAYFEPTWLGFPALPGVVPMAVTGVALLAMLQLTADACRGLHELRLASLFSGGQTGGLLSNIIFLILIAATLVTSRPSFVVAVALNLVAMAISLPIAVFGLLRASRARIGSSTPDNADTSSNLTVRRLLGFSLPMMVIQLLTFAVAQGDLWIAGAYCPHDELGLYGAARRLILLVAMPLQMLNFTVIASISVLHCQDRLGELERLLRGAAALAAWPAAGIILFLIFAGEPTLELLFGPYFRQAAPTLSILAVGQLFLVCAGSCDCALAMTGHQLSALAVSLTAAVMLAFIGTWAARQFGIVGLAVASASIVATQSACLWLLAKKLIGVWTHPALRPGLSTR